MPFRFLLAPRAPASSEYGSRLMDQRTVHVRSASEHEQTYGFWDCLAPFEMGIGLSAVHRAEVEAARGFWVDAGRGDGSRVEVPDELVALGTVRVCALVDPRAARMTPELWLSTEDRHGSRGYLRSLGLAVPDDRTRLHALWLQTITPEHRREARQRMLAAMVEAMTRVTAAVYGS